MGILLTTDEKATRAARSLWAFGVGAIILGTTAGLTFCRPPKPPTSTPELVPAEMTIRVGQEDECPPDSAHWVLWDFDRATSDYGVCYYRSR
jgi:hypothetical protein